MPKMKTNSSAKKRFTMTASGKIKRRQAFKNHILTKKTTKRKLNLGKTAFVSEQDEPNMKFLLTIGK
jgi:large subunit ribosomal protein L35